MEIGHGDGMDIEVRFSVLKAPEDTVGGGGGPEIFDLRPDPYRRAPQERQRIGASQRQRNGMINGAAK